MQPVLQTERLLLRPFQMSDAPDVQRLAGAFEVADTTLVIPHPYKEGMAEAWIKTLTDEAANGVQATFAIVLRETNELCGCIGFGIDARNKSAELGYWIGVPFWGKNICTEAAREIIRFSFENLGLDRVQATPFVRNPASGRVMQKIGMKLERRLSNYYQKNGHHEDAEQYSISKSDWLSSTHKQ